MKQLAGSVDKPPHSETAYCERPCSTSFPSFLVCLILTKNVFVFHNMEKRMDWDKYSRNSRGWSVDPIAIVHPRIYIGPCFNITEKIFERYDITHAVNCAGPIFNIPWIPTDKYKCINAEDSTEFDITSVYPLFESIMNKFLADSNCKSIYVHCQAGINRSAFLVLMYVCIKFQYKMDYAVKNILLQRPCCFRNSAFRKQVTEYIKKLE